MQVNRIKDMFLNDDPVELMADAEATSREHKNRGRLEVISEPWLIDHETEHKVMEILSENGHSLPSLFASLELGEWYEIHMNWVIDNSEGLTDTGIGLVQKLPAEDAIRGWEVMLPPEASLLTPFPGVLVVHNNGVSLYTNISTPVMAWRHTVKKRQQ